MDGDCWGRGREGKGGRSLSVFTQNEAHKVLGDLCRLQCSFSGVFTFDTYQHRFVLLLLLL